LSGHVFILTSEFQCGEKVAAQTYDRAAAVVGKYHGLQELIEYIKKTAMFIRGYQYQLN